MTAAKSAATRKPAKKPSAKVKTSPAKIMKAAKPKAAKTTANARKSVSTKAKPAAKPKAVKTTTSARKDVSTKAKPAASKPKTVAAKPAAKKAKNSRKPAPKSALSKSSTSKPKTAAKPNAEDLQGFSVKDHVVYPSHGVGQITGVEAHEIGDISLRVFVVVFDKEKMTLRVPIGKASTSGMRRLSSQQKMEQAISTLRGRARTRRVMWSRRAQEYDAKLNSGDPVSIAEVVRDLHRDEGQPDQSYSERQMYEAALERLAREFAAVENTDTEQAAEKLENVLRAA